MSVKRKVDYLIVGQGLAGIHLALMLLLENRDVLVVDNGNPNAASKVNLGLMNPVTGRKLKLAWKVDRVFPFAETWYRRLEQVLGLSLFEKKNLIRFFIDEKQKRIWEEKQHLPEYRPFLAEPQRWQEYQSRVNAPYGGVEITGSALVQVERLLAGARDWLRDRNALLEAALQPEEVILNQGRVLWQDVEAQCIIFCEGFRAVSNPYFDWLPFSPVKGEAIDVEIPELPADRILHRGIFIRPLGDRRFRVGSTHLHRDYVEMPTEAGVEQLKNRLREFVSLPFRVLNALTGIRPTIQDSRPVIGMHPEIPQVGVLNGLGSKGVSLSPYCARELVNHLLQGAPIDPELDVQRFWKA